MESAVEQVAKNEKLDMILDKRMVLYLGNKALDVNDKVQAAIRSLNDGMKRTLGELAALLQGEVKGPPDLEHRGYRRG